MIIRPGEGSQHRRSPCRRGRPPPAARRRLLRHPRLRRHRPSSSARYPRRRGASGCRVATRPPRPPAEALPRAGRPPQGTVPMGPGGAQMPAQRGRAIHLSSRVCSEVRRRATRERPAQGSRRRHARLGAGAQVPDCAAEADLEGPDPPNATGDAAFEQPSSQTERIWSRSSAARICPINTWWSAPTTTTSAIRRNACAGQTSVDMICNGATDNAAGVAAVLGVGRALAHRHSRPRRSVVLALWDSEEDGLLGSSYYTQHPLVPLARTVGYVNFDIQGANLLPACARRPSRRR